VMGILAEWLSFTSSFRKFLQYHIVIYVSLVLLSSNYVPILQNDYSEDIRSRSKKKLDHVE
jgi:hypothetical protein